jgi:hypothetical protein
LRKLLLCKHPSTDFRALLSSGLLQSFFRPRFCASQIHSSPPSRAKPCCYFPLTSHLFPSGTRITLTNPLFQHIDFPTIIYRYSPSRASSPFDANNVLPLESNCSSPTFQPNTSTILDKRAIYARSQTFRGEWRAVRISGIRSSLRSAEELWEIS